MIEILIEFLFGSQGLFSPTQFIAPAIIAAGIAAAAGAGNAVASGTVNRKSRKWQEKMFHMTNEYNSPLEQRKRLEAAGLNPNLVYGGSAGGTAGTASQPAKPDFNVPDFTPIGQAGQEGLMNYYNIKSIQAGTDVNEERAKNIEQDTQNKAIDGLNKAIRNSSDALSYRQKKELYDTNIAMAKKNLENLAVNTDYTRGRNNREQRIIDETESKLRAEISNAKKQGQILSEEAIMKRIDRIMYQNYKVRPQDPIYYRIIGEILSNMGVTPFKQ